MKTLDEVIKAINWCTELDQSGCGACPYSDNADNRCYEEDALHYLKELKEARAILATAREEAKKQIDAIKIMAINSMANQCETCPWRKHEDLGKNEPLTWDELKSMEGKPVWVEECNGDTKGWLLILRTNYDVINCTTKHGNSFYLYKSSYSEKWQAYRKELINA